MNRTAFIRCCNEENTVIASLMSIENIFSNIVIIHSNITDSSLQQIENYSKGRTNIIIEQYPHHVYPPHHEAYKHRDYLSENSLASYYNFGIDICKRIGGSIMKIDADQIYIEENVLSHIQMFENNRILYEGLETNIYQTCFWGVNTFVYEDQLVLSEKFPFNGMNDHFIISENADFSFYQSSFYEVIKLPDNAISIPASNQPSWFHFMKKIAGVQDIKNTQSFDYSIEEYAENNLNEIVLLNDELANLFIKKVAPILQASNSPYKNIRVK